jgi:hypothetical protein
MKPAEIGFSTQTGGFQLWSVEEEVVASSNHTSIWTRKEEVMVGD